ncbi:DUF2397 domain-containing protein [Micromonospora antibiotica]|uniref:DUF2397 domain-containing protein n=1 Tax=Micromonospora antibiotica TaxID=2807623 RepID=A0ABS3V6I3_9ACTN|nr:DUF2397 domain-containing protein [Micromonospora antibiotica]MBO4161224.1 DUF2397 domain-containing protein [Micromonospora antibiotica]
MTDSRRAMAYLVAPGSDDYIRIMAVLESSVTDLTPSEIAVLVSAGGPAMSDTVVQKRLDKLKDWTATTGRSDPSRIRRHADILARNWRWTATPAGRQVHRFYTSVLAATPTMREIPLPSLARIVESVEQLATALALPRRDDAQIAELIGRLFTGHDDLDTALVGAEDSLASLADRFDLDQEATAELKGLLVDYATHVAGELERGAQLAHDVLHRLLRPYFTTLAEIAVAQSQARALIERGALTASRGGQVSDWAGLTAWCDPHTGRSSRFALRLVRALPGMHANLRRLHSSAGYATGRARALLLAKACLDPQYGTAILQAATGDHRWRKLYGESDDTELSSNPTWRGGPAVELPELLRTTGRTGARGRAPAARDDSAARAAVQASRELRRAEHAAAIEEILASEPGEQLSPRAAQVALAALMTAVRAGLAPGTTDRRTGLRDGLSCTLFHIGDGAGVLVAPTWRVLLPGRMPVFHLPGRWIAAPRPTRRDPATRAVMLLQPVPEAAA